MNFPLTPSARLRDWLGDHDVTDVARLIEELGFDGISVTDHPYPPRSWLASGGHHALDPFVSLGAAAVVTRRISLITGLAVAGYRNPYLTAKSASTVDFLSNGRLVLGLGAGYLREEFAALGADFTKRGERFDAAIPAIRAAWTATDNEGPFFPAHGHDALPHPTRPGGPPIWIGGNSRAARNRVVSIGDGWMPLTQWKAKVSRTKTPALDDLESLATQIAELRARRAELGRPNLEVMLTPFEKDLLSGGNVEEFCEVIIDRREAYEEAGVTWLLLKPESDSFEAFTREMEVLASALVSSPSQ